MQVTRKMITENPVHAASVLAKRFEVTDPATAKKKLVTKRLELERLRELKAELLPVENDSDSLEKKMADLRSEIASLLTFIVPAPATLPIFDLSCFTWRDETGFPRLIPFALESNSFEFGIRASRGWHQTNYTNYTSPRLPAVIASMFKDVYKILREHRKSGQGIKITAKFGGIIPDDIKDIIQGAEEIFDGLYIVAEVRNWKIEDRKPVVSMKGDPLLIGFDGKDYRLIAEFDTTSIEQVAAERSKGRKSS